MELVLAAVAVRNFGHWSRQLVQGLALSGRRNRLKIAYPSKFGCHPSHRLDKVRNETENGQLVVTGLECLRAGKHEVIEISKDNLVFFQNGSMTDASSFGSMTKAPEQLTKKHSGGWDLWENWLLIGLNLVTLLLSIPVFQNLNGPLLP